MIQLSANLSLLFNENEFLDRFKEAKINGFNAVEFQFPYDFEALKIKREIDKNNLILSIFNSKSLKRSLILLIFLRSSIMLSARLF